MPLVVGLVVLGAVRDWSNFTFDDFKTTFGRQYGDAATEARRRDIFHRHRDTILHQNAEYSAGRSTWYASVNDFTDLTEAEFSAQKKGLSPNRPAPGVVAVSAPSSAQSTPFRVDWRDHTSSGGSGVITPVKDQKVNGQRRDLRTPCSPPTWICVRCLAFVARLRRSCRRAAPAGRLRRPQSSRRTTR